MKHDEENSAADSGKLPVKLQPMMLAHLALTGDVTLQREWRDRIEGVLQQQALEREHDPVTRALLLNTSVWQQIRTTGKVGSIYNMALASVWMAWLIPVYALYHGFGWIAASTYLLPVPLAWKVGRYLFERGALKGMRELKNDDSVANKLAVFTRSISRTAIAGFGFGFTLVFFQELISAFMTPLPTIAMELYYDFYEAVLAGSITGAASVALAPLLARNPPK